MAACSRPVHVPVCIPERPELDSPSDPTTVVIIMTIVIVIVIFIFIFIITSIIVCRALFRACVQPTHAHDLAVAAKAQGRNLLPVVGHGRSAEDQPVLLEDDHLKAV